MSKQIRKHTLFSILISGLFLSTAAIAAAPAISHQAQVCQTPTAAAKALVLAWQRHQRPKTVPCGTQTLIQQMFKVKASAANAWQFQGCRNHDAKKAACFFSYEGGGMTLLLRSNAQTQWLVYTLQPVAD